MVFTANEKIKVLSSSEIIDNTPENSATEKIAISGNALTILKARYLKKDAQGNVAEEPHDMFMRVAQVIAGAEDLFGRSDVTERVQTLFYNMMVTGEFLPNSPTLMNAGRDLGQLSACFVLPIEDSMESIFGTLKDAALIHKSGGGTGFSFSRLRPKKDIVKSTSGISSGPVSFMSVYDSATETIKQGGTRRGANMGILRVDHTDIRDFITCKRDNKSFGNFNISVAVTDEFMEAVKNGDLYNLVNPHTGKVTKREKAREIFDLIIENAHASGDPGIIFIDRMNEKNPLPHLGEFESTNPCGEQPLRPYESCNLGSINLSLMVRSDGENTAIDWERLGRITRLSVRFLDNVIEVNKYPLEKIDMETKKSRKIGLGVMGFADMLIKLGVPYDSEDAETVAGQIMAFIDSESKTESHHLAESRGAFPAFEGSVYDRRGEPPLRNATTTTIAPTGTISIIASCSSGIEPVFALAYKRNVLGGTTLSEFHPVFKKMAEDAGILDEAAKKAVLESPSLEHLGSIPDSFKRIFRTVTDISVEWHIRIQAAFQRHIDNAVSKTINFPGSATVNDISNAFMMAYDSGLKGTTIYRYGSKENQVLTIEKESGETGVQDTRINVKPRPRPDQTRGTTEKIKTGCGNLYVTINSDESGLCEVFCQMGRSGGCTSSQSEAISRLISLALRSGVGLDEIVSQLKGIRCPSPIWQNGKMILSCSDAIATALLRYPENEPRNNVTGTVNSGEIPVYTKDADTIKLSGVIERKSTPGTEMAGVCPDCGSILETSEGCLVCRACGFTKCM
jgi:ribonucleoside-diphosphate reductase alpha chain